MIGRQRSVEAQLKTTQQLFVRFAHAPCVKLTLQTRADLIATPPVVRVLRLQKDTSARRITAG
jgi:hypothetical protein